MMVIVNRIGDSITGACNMVPFGVKYTEEKYNLMKSLEQEAAEADSMEELNAIVEQFKLLTKESYKELVETACPNIFVNEATGKFYLKNKNVISKRTLPKAFVDRILTSVEKGIDFTPIIKCWTRFLRNRNYSDAKAIKFANYLNQTYMDGTYRDELIQKHGLSVDVATERATQFQVPITMEGLICTYKVSRELKTKFDSATGEEVDRYQKEYDTDSGEVVSDGLPKEVEDRIFYPAVQGLHSGDAFFCGDLTGQGKLGHFIKVGHVHSLDSWNKVNCDDNDSCVPGLHTGNQDYIRGYAGSGTETHNVFVDPMHIGAITDDGSGALRVLSYFVHSSRAGQNRGIYHSSKYAAMTDAEWEQLRAEAIAFTNQTQEDLSEEIEELSSY